MRLSIYRMKKKKSEVKERNGADQRMHRTLRAVRCVCIHLISIVYNNRAIRKSVAVVASSIRVQLLLSERFVSWEMLKNGRAGRLRSTRLTFPNALVRQEQRSCEIFQMSLLCFNNHIVAKIAKVSCLNGSWPFSLIQRFSLEEHWSKESVFIFKFAKWSGWSL